MITPNVDISHSSLYIQSRESVSLAKQERESIYSKVNKNHGLQKVEDPDKELH